MPPCTLLFYQDCGTVFIQAGFNELIIPSIWETETFTKKLGPEKEGQMWTFTDKGNRQVCLIPEVTGIIQEMWRDNWSKEWPRPSKIFYISKCYRYERPQKGRYREFTQFGIEILGSESPDMDTEAKETLVNCMKLFPSVEWEMKETVKRGLNYYVQDGFEVECPSLGAQKQVAGGGRYAEGVGWAIGVERLMLAI